MGDVVDLNGVTSLDLDPDKVLEAAKGNIDHVIVIGYHKDGSEYFASSTSYVPDIVWLLERYKHFLLNNAQDQ